MEEETLPAVDGMTLDLLPDKDKVYFNDYSTLVQQQGMLQDTVRTSIYQFSMLENTADFKGKTVLDVGAGTGILSFFAARAGASKVYAVEASTMAINAKKLAEGNGLGDVVKVLNQRVEEVELDERVDVLISEPLGIALVNERMIESYLIARDRLLKPGGKMFPDKATMYAAPFSDDSLYQEQYIKTGFWNQTNFYGVDLRPLSEEATKFYFSQPVVGAIAPQTLIAPAVPYAFDFNTCTLDALKKFTIPFEYNITSYSQVHGIAIWFDCTFPGCNREVLLGTSPFEPLTHWYQVRCLLMSPLAVGPGHRLCGELRFESNASRGYNVHMTVSNANTGVTETNTVVTQCALHHFQYTSQQSTSYQQPQFYQQPDQPSQDDKSAGGAAEPSDSVA